jgi:hypothetical protein
MIPPESGGMIRFPKDRRAVFVGRIITKGHISKEAGGGPPPGSRQVRPGYFSRLFPSRRISRSRISRSSLLLR